MRGGANEEGEGRGQQGGRGVGPMRRRVMGGVNKEGEGWSQQEGG